MASRQALHHTGQDDAGRWDLAPAQARLRGHEGNRRLNQRWRTFNTRKKNPVIANVAIAPELAGWAWSLAVLD